MATSEQTGGKSTIQELCEQVGQNYTPEIAKNEATLQQLSELARLAELASVISNPHLQYDYSTSTRTLITPEINRTHAESHSIACERHPWRNEDASFVLSEKGKALVGGVFDGLGGYSGSERASATAAATALSRYSAECNEYMTPAEAAAFATEVLTAAEAAIDEDYALIATTAAMASVHVNPENGELFANIAWAGDSRVFVIRNNTIIYRTLDDGIADDIEWLEEVYPDERPEYRAQAFLESTTMDRYDLPRELLRLFHQRNIVANCLGGRDTVEIRTHQLYVQPGDVILASSDGVHDNLTNDEILTVIRAGGGVKELTEKALRRSRDDDHVRAKPDDITAVILTIPDEIPSRPSSINAFRTDETEGQNNHCFTCGRQSPHWSGGGIDGCMYCNHVNGNS